MLRSKHRLLIIALLNASLIIGPVQMALASTAASSQAHSHKNKTFKVCKHAMSARHMSRRHIRTAMPAMHHHVNKQDASMMQKDLALDDNKHQGCQCPDKCSNCCGSHATVALLDFEFHQLSRVDSSEPDAKIYYYKQIFLPVEIPPPAV